MISELKVTISDASGPQGTLEVLWDRWDGDRPGFQWRATSWPDTNDDSAVLAYGSDLRLGSADDANHVKAMATLISFLEVEGEKYRYAMRDGDRDTSAEAVERRTGDGYLFNELTAEWAYGVSDALSIALLELEGDDD